MHDDDRYGPVGGFGGRHPDFDERYGHPGSRYGPGPGPERFSSHEFDERDRRGPYGPEDGDYRPSWREREAAGPGYGGGFRGEGARPGYEPRGGFDRERYEAHRPSYGDRDLLPPPPPPRAGAAAPAAPEPAAAAAAPAAGYVTGPTGRGDDSDSDVDPEREAFEAELARVAADMERVSPAGRCPAHCGFA